MFNSIFKFLKFKYIQFINISSSQIQFQRCLILTLFLKFKYIQFIKNTFKFLPLLPLLPLPRNRETTNERMNPEYPPTSRINQPINPLLLSNFEFFHGKTHLSLLIANVEANKASCQAQTRPPPSSLPPPPSSRTRAHQRAAG